jgi:two-component system phosphate regulon response regulator PhoB
MTKVLLAEDDVTMLSLLKTLLKMEGFQVVALDADEDIPKAVQREHPDVLLLDVHLSGQNGLQILDKLRQNPDAASVRVVMTSGLNLKEDCLAHGADDFLLKPYMPDELISVLKRNLKPA